MVTGQSEVSFAVTSIVTESRKRRWTVVWLHARNNGIVYRTVCSSPGISQTGVAIAGALSPEVLQHVLVGVVSTSKPLAPNQRSANTGYIVGSRVPTDGERAAWWCFWTRLVGPMPHHDAVTLTDGQTLQGSAGDENIPRMSMAHTSKNGTILSCCRHGFSFIGTVKRLCLHPMPSTVLQGVRSVPTSACVSSCAFKSPSMAVSNARTHSSNPCLCLTPFSSYVANRELTTFRISYQSVSSGKAARADLQRRLSNRNVACIANCRPSPPLDIESTATN